MLQVLQLDINGAPQSWITPQEAATHYASDSVAWFDGEAPLTTLRGGWNAKMGRQSLIEVYPIIALNGASRVNLFDATPALTGPRLAQRDRLTCCYCGQQFRERNLTIDHVTPRSKGGADDWLNVVSACSPCNSRKGSKSPEEAGMPLLFLPYRPSLYESFLLSGRHVRADVHEWLRSRLPKGSRLL